MSGARQCFAMDRWRQHPLAIAAAVYCPRCLSRQLLAMLCALSPGVECPCFNRIPPMLWLVVHQVLNQLLEMGITEELARKTLTKVGISPPGPK